MYSLNLNDPISTQVDPISRFNSRSYGDEIAKNYDKTVERICDIYQKLINLINKAENDIARSAGKANLFDNKDFELNLCIGLKGLGSLVKVEDQWLRSSTDYQSYLNSEKENALNNMNKLLDAEETKQHLNMLKVSQNKNKIDNLKEELDRRSKEHMTKSSCIRERYQIALLNKISAYRVNANKLISLYENRIELTVQSIDKIAKADNRQFILEVNERFNLTRTALSDEIDILQCKIFRWETGEDIDFKEIEKNSKKCSELRNTVLILDNQYSKDWERIFRIFCNEDMKSSKGEMEIKGSGDANPNGNDDLALPADDESKESSSSNSNNYRKPENENLRETTLQLQRDHAQTKKAAYKQRDKSFY